MRLTDSEGRSFDISDAYRAVVAWLAAAQAPLA
jgi:hypothetical protein